MGFVHHPALDEFSFLPGIPAVYYDFGFVEQAFYDLELFLDSRVIDHLGFKLFGKHGQVVQVPAFPMGFVIVGFLQGAQMPKGVSYLIPIAFKIAVVLGIGSQNGCDFSGDTGFFGNTDLHFSFLILKPQIRNLEIGMERKLLGVMNGRFFTAKAQGFRSAKSPTLRMCVSVCDWRKWSKNRSVENRNSLPQSRETLRSSHDYVWQLLLIHTSQSWQHNHGFFI